MHHTKYCILPFFAQADTKLRFGLAYASKSAIDSHVCVRVTAMAPCPPPALQFLMPFGYKFKCMACERHGCMKQTEFVIGIRFGDRYIVGKHSQAALIMKFISAFCLWCLWRMKEEYLCVCVCKCVSIVSSRFRTSNCSRMFP